MKNEEVLNDVMRKTFPKTIFIRSINERNKTQGIHFSEEWLNQEYSTELAGEWIPVSERLPKTADVYRVTRYYPNNVMNPKYLVDACTFDGSDTWYDDNRINHERAYVNNVIAWQENPEPYKAESEEQ